MTVEQYNARKAAGKCTAARSCEAPLVPGCQMCARHKGANRDKGRAWDHSPKGAAHRKAKLQARRARGQCSRCGKNKVKRFRWCGPCRKWSSAWLTQHRAAKRARVGETKVTG